MKTSFKILIILLFSATFIVGCSRKKDNFISKNFHAVTAEFNALYNGNIALEQGKENLVSDYADNYWEILPIERMQVSDEVLLPGQSKNENFQRAEEKAVKAIQMHSMNIGGKEKNPQIDEAYLLLGKARYYDQRFVPALEAFNFILFKYRASDKINQAKIWKEKVNIRLENDLLAIQNLKRLLYQEDLESQDLADATAMLAQAYINTKSLDSAVTQLEIAAQETKNNDERGRYRFIQGQLYNKLGDVKNANMAFDKVIDLNRKTPRVYLIGAHIEKAKNANFENGNNLAVLELLTDLEEDRENRPYLDKIYYQIADYHKKNGSESLAEVYYNKSLSVGSQDKLLNALSYHALGNMNFDYSKYKIAGAYYDSTMLNMVQNSKDFRAVKRKRDNLDDVIYYEDVAQRNDSILSLVNLSEEERLALFIGYTDNLKQKAKEQKEKEEIAKRSTGLITTNEKTRTSLRGEEQSGDAFYFYNPITVAFGKNEFIKTWGERQLEDNWRWSNKRAINSNTIADGALANATEEELFDPQFYISRIPTSEREIDSLSKDRNFAYYQLGLIYKDKFAEYYLAKEKLQILLESNPEERLVLPAKYNLYKIYLLLNLNGEAEITKNEIISSYPDSRYATILLNPEASLGKDENSPENIYTNLYKQFENQEYADVISQCDKYIINFDGEAIVPKFEFLKAVSKGRLNGYGSYEESINFIALNYPNSPEGKKAEEMMSSVIPLLAKKEFEDDAMALNFKAIYQFTDVSMAVVDEFIIKLDEALKKIGHVELSSSKDVYDQNNVFVVVHGFNSAGGALEYSTLLNDYKQKISKDYFTISSQNYQIIQIHKNLEDYLKSQ